MSKKQQITAANEAEISAIVASQITENDDIDSFIAGIDESLAIEPEVKVLEQSETPDGRIIQTIEIDGVESVREVTEDEAFGTDLTDEDVALLDAKSAALEVQTPTLDVVEPGDQAPEGGTESHTVEPVEMPDFLELVDAVSDEDRTQMVGFIVAALDAREEYEVHEKANDNILKSLRKSREKLVIGTNPAAVLAACGVDPSVFNRHKVSSNRYNVYAIDKVRDLVSVLLTGSFGNAINRAVVSSLVRFHKAKAPFTMERAKDACSDKRRIPAGEVVTGLLMRHTVAASTAPTQASSTMQALETLGVVRNVGGKNGIYELLDTPQTRRLMSIAV